ASVAKILTSANKSLTSPMKKSKRNAATVPPQNPQNCPTVSPFSLITPSHFSDSRRPFLASSATAVAAAEGSEKGRFVLSVGFVRFRLIAPCTLLDLLGFDFRGCILFVVV
ncbi:hypothetical protein AKJ16_DCAP05330, partial [Drosera capensis]